MAWHAAPALNRLLTEYDELYPKRSKASDGAVGDTSHQARRSNHNPDFRAPGKRKGVVRARDLTTKRGNRAALVRAAVAHPATSYVISNGKIYSRKHGFRARKYTGSNGHFKHVHVSVRSTAAAENSKKRWFGKASSGSKGKGNDRAISLAVIKRAEAKFRGKGHKTKSVNVKRLQFALNTKHEALKLFSDGPLKETGLYDARTHAAVRKYQKAKRELKGDADGWVGPRTLWHICNANRTYPTA